MLGMFLLIILYKHVLILVGLLRMIEDNYRTPLHSKIVFESEEGWFLFS